MVECHNCQKNVDMPFKCSLCNNKFCGRHRLPESHNCINIGVYKTDGYRRQKIKKKRELQSIKSGTSEYSMSSGNYGRSRVGGYNIDTWSAGSKNNTAFVGGLILGVGTVLRGILGTLVGDFMIFTLVAILTTGISFFILSKVRDYIASRMGGYTEFLIWPIGVAITWITSLIGFMFLVFGYFTNNNDPKVSSNLGIASILSFFGFWALINIFALPVLSVGLSSQAIISGIYVSGQMLLWYGILMMLPFGMLDGARIYQYDSQKFWLLLVFAIVLFIVNIFVFPMPIV